MPYLRQSWQSAFLTTVTCLFALWSAVVTADVRVFGTVADRTRPLGGVTIEGNWRAAPHRHKIGQTSADGSFEIRLAESDLDGSRHIQLFFEKEGFQVNSLRTSIPSSGDVGPLNIGLLTVRQKQLLREFKQFERLRKPREQHTIFLSDLKVYDDADLGPVDCCRATPCESRIGIDSKGKKCECPKNENISLQCKMREAVRWGIRSRLTAYQLEMSHARPVIPLITVQAIRPGFTSDEYKLSDLGIYLNALGIIQATGRPVSGSSGEESIRLNSQFLVPVREEGQSVLRTHLKRIGDVVPKDGLADPTSIGEQLQDDWAHMVLLAVAEFRLGENGTRSDHAQLLDYLRAAKLRSDDPALTRELDVMISRVAAVLREMPQ